MNTFGKKTLSMTLLLNSFSLYCLILTCVFCLLMWMNGNQVKVVHKSLEIVCTDYSHCISLLPARQLCCEQVWRAGVFCGVCLCIFLHKISQLLVGNRCNLVGIAYVPWSESYFGIFF